VFWFNPSETFIDISDGGTTGSPFKESHWISESGEVDFFILPGPTPSEIYKQYTLLTGDLFFICEVEISYSKHIRHSAIASYIFSGISSM
jgi:hypothetical protein